MESHDRIQSGATAINEVDRADSENPALSDVISARLDHLKRNSSGKPAAVKASEELKKRIANRPRKERETWSLIRAGWVIGFLARVPVFTFASYMYFEYRYFHACFLASVGASLIISAIPWRKRKNTRLALPSSKNSTKEGSPAETSTASAMKREEAPVLHNEQIGLNEEISERDFVDKFRK